VKWLRFAARQGHVEANYALGLAYAEGRGVEQSASEALGWMLQAARKGHPQANEFVRRVLSKTTPIQPAPPREEDKK
jgi:TPR repeat protein